MQKKIAQSLMVGSLALAIGLSGFGVASAKTSKTTKVKTATVKTTKVAKTKVIKGHVRTLPGKIVSVAGTSITMRKGNQNFIIDASNIAPVNRKGSTIAVTDIVAGHKISVRGLVKGTSVTNISKLRDITLPVSTVKD